VRATSQSARDVMRCPDVWLTGDIPATIHRCIIEAEALIRRGGAAQWPLVWCLKHRRFGLRNVLPARLQHENLGAFHTEGVSALPTGGPGTHDDDVVRFI